MSPEVAAIGLEQTVGAIYSKYGINGVACDGKLLLMPLPSISGDDSDGTQPFNGRLGKLRHFGLAVMAACGAISADLVQLVMCFPLAKEVAAPDDPLTAYLDPTRAPVVFPLLLGHVLTHVVAAMCATCGRARARSDCLELAWPAPFSRRGSFSGPQRDNEALSVSVANDCEGFIKLGVLARMLQILLNRLDVSPEGDSVKRDSYILAHLRVIIRKGGQDSVVSRWQHTCFVLLEQTLSNDSVSSYDEPSPPAEEPNDFLENQFLNACTVAASETVAFLSDVGVIYQMLVPGVASTFQGENSNECNERETDLSGMLETLQKLQRCMGLEPVDGMLQSSLVREIIRNWYESASSHARKSVVEESGVYSSKIRSRLFQTEGFRAYDWPMEATSPMLVESIASPNKEIRPATSPLVSFSSKKSIQLLGGFAVTCSEDSTALARPRVATLATSYTDLYATLGTLCPDCDQTALCLICGEVSSCYGC